MIDKLKNLPYLSLRGTPNLDDVNIIYIDYSIESNNEKTAQVFSQKAKCETILLEENEELTSVIENIFITMIKEFNDSKQIINIQKKLLDSTMSILENTDTNILDVTIEKFLSELKSTGTESFAFIPQNFSYKISPKNINIIETDLLEDEIIFGRKTRFDEPGIILVTNEEGLKNYPEIKLGMFDIGFYPQKQYFTIKLV